MFCDARFDTKPLSRTFRPHDSSIKNMGQSIRGIKLQSSDQECGMPWRERRFSRSNHNELVCPAGGVELRPVCGHFGSGESIVKPTLMVWACFFMIMVITSDTQCTEDAG
jgi:hypothetical protein